MAGSEVPGRVVLPSRAGGGGALRPYKLCTFPVALGSVGVRCPTVHALRAESVSCAKLGDFGVTGAGDDA